MKKSLLALMTLCAGAFCFVENASAGEIDLTYASGDTIAWGNNRLETYDIAIFIPGQALKGKKITQVTVPCRATVATNISMWLTTELGLETIDNVVCASANVLRQNMENERTLVLNLDTPYEITEEGIYVGYSLTIPSGSILASDKTNPGRYPITVTEGYVENGFFLHSSRSYSAGWQTGQTGAQSKLDYSADIKVVIEGDFKEHAVGVDNLASSIVAVGEPSTTTVTFSNRGTESVSSLDYVLTIGNETQNGTLNFNPALKPNYVSSYEEEIALPAVDKVGSYEMSLAFTKVNGVDNQETDGVGTAYLDVPSFVPTHRPVMEEFTALGCGYCPQGYVALKWMKENYEDFIAVSYHTNFNGVTDSMSCVSTSSWIGYPSSLPSAVLDRQALVSPYVGNTNYHMGIALTWEEFAAQIAPCDIDVMPVWSSDDKDVINIKMNAKFMSTQTNADYRFGYFVVADSVSSPYWGQVNYCNGSSFAGYPSEFGWDPFTKGPSTVYGLVFDDIALASPTPRGATGSIPNHIAMDETVEWETSFSLSSVSKYDYLIHPDKKNIRIVGFVIDGKTGLIVNGNHSYVMTEDEFEQGGIETVTGNQDAEVESVTLYDLNGRVVNNPANGFFIRTEKLTDGTVRTSKILVR